MAFYISYQMITGTGRREAATPDEALEMLIALQLAGAGTVVIEDHNGTVYRSEDLLTLGGAMIRPHGSRPRDR